MIPLYNHPITPMNDFRSLVRDLNHGRTQRREQKQAVAHAKAVMNNPQATVACLLKAGNSLLAFNSTTTKAIPLFERAQALGHRDPALDIELGELYARKWEASRPIFNVTGEPNRQYLIKAIEHLERGIAQHLDACAELLLAGLYADHRVPDPERAIDFAFEKLDARRHHAHGKNIILAQVAHMEPKVGGTSVVYVLSPSAGFARLPKEKQERVRDFLRAESAHNYLAQITPKSPKKSCLWGCIPGQMLKP